MQHLAAPDLRRPLSSAPAETVSSSPSLVNVGASVPPALAVGSGAVTLPPILVADDDADDIYFIERLIKKTGIKNPIKTFNDGSEVVNYLGSHLACAVARNHLPSLLFLDLKMAGLGGFGFLEWARQQKGLSPLTMVVLSNSSEPGDMARALALGAHRYLIKYPCVQTMTTIVRSVYPLTLVK